MPPALESIEFQWWSDLPPHRHAQVVELYNSVIVTETILGYAQPLDERAGQELVGALADALRRRAQQFFAILEHDRLIGMTLLTPNKLPNCAHLAELSKGIIHPDCRGRGVLERALRFVAESCVERGIEVITLDVREHCRSHRLWAGIGFIEYGRLPDYARVDGASHAGVYMYIESRTLARNLAARINAPRPAT